MRIPGCGFRLMCHPETTSQSECGFRDVLSAWAVIGKARPTLRCRSVCLTPAPCIEFDSPRFGGSVDGLRPGQGARSTSRLYRIEALRGESAYLLRKYAPASVGCRRPHPLATNASRLLNARALHRVRFSAVSVSNKKQVETLLYLPITIGGGAENRTPVHESPLIGISKLSRWFYLGRFARSDTLAAS